MTIKKVSKKEIPGSKLYSRSDNLRILEEFANAGYEWGEVEDFTQKTAGYCASSLNLSIKRYKMFHLRAISRGNRVFLHNEIARS